VDVVVELTFHQLNTFVGVPEYDVALVSADPEEEPLAPQSLARMPRQGPRVGDPDTASPLVLNASEPMLGGTLLATFDGNALEERGAYDVVVTEGDAELARVRLDLGAMR
jgi:hypothetical protein